MKVQFFLGFSFLFIVIMCSQNKIIIRIRSTSNNTFIVFSDLNNNTLFKGSTGLLGLKGQKRSTPAAARTLVSSLAKKAYKCGYFYAFLLISGFGKARDSCLSWIALEKIKILHVKDVTPLPFNGCKKRKKRRV